MKMAVIGDADTVALFAFAGASITVVATDDIEKQFDELVDIPEVGVIVTTEHIADQLMKKITKIKLQRELPIIVEVPDKRGKIVVRENSLDTLIRRAVGIGI
jgi:V/A-type H+-transporting ATPase subunit F